jgi:hypothetical protein
VPFFALTSTPALPLLRNFVPAFLEGGTFTLEANVRNVARIKLRYYPLPQEEGTRRFCLSLVESVRTTSHRVWRQIGVREASIPQK